MLTMHLRNIKCMLHQFPEKGWKLYARWLLVKKFTLDRRLTFCKKQEEPIKVAQLKKIGLTKTQWSTAGGHLYLRAWMLCRGGAWISAERALIHYFWLADQWLIAAVPVTNPPSNLIYKSMADVTDIFYGNIEQKLQYQIKFLTLSPALQKKLLSAPEFQQPFRPTASSDHWD